MIDFGRPLFSLPHLLKNDGHQQAEGKKRVGTAVALYKLSGPKSLRETPEHSVIYFSILAAP